MNLYLHFVVPAAQYHLVFSRHQIEYKMFQQTLLIPTVSIFMNSSSVVIQHNAQYYVLKSLMDKSCYEYSQQMFSDKNKCGVLVIPKDGH